MEITQEQAKVIIEIHQEALNVEQLNGDLMTSTGVVSGSFRVWVWSRLNTNKTFIREDIRMGRALFSDELNKALYLLRNLRRELEVDSCQ